MGLSLEEDHEVILDQLLETLVVESADVLVIAGDIFDRASPPNSSIRQFNRFLKRVAEETEAAVVMISGNHDSGDRIEAMSVFSTASRVLVRGIADAVETPLLRYPFPTNTQRGKCSGMRVSARQQMSSRPRSPQQGVRCPKERVGS